MCTCICSELRHTPSALDVAVLLHSALRETTAPNSRSLNPPPLHVGMIHAYFPGPDHLQPLGQIGRRRQASDAPAGIQEKRDWRHHPPAGGKGGRGGVDDGTSNEDPPLSTPTGRVYHPPAPLGMKPAPQAATRFSRALQDQ